MWAEAAQPRVLNVRMKSLTKYGREVNAMAAGGRGSPTGRKGTDTPGCCWVTCPAPHGVGTEQGGRRDGSTALPWWWDMSPHPREVPGAVVVGTNSTFRDLCSKQEGGDKATAREAAWFQGRFPPS